MMEKVEKGDYPDEPIDCPNLWRVKSGDRLTWVGAERPDRRSVNGILSILNCRESALAIGEGNWESAMDFVEFGELTADEMKSDDVVRCQAAVNAVRKLGLPREWAPDWMLG